MLQKLSDEQHFGEEENHNFEYDHEAFLGKEEARHFEELTPEESKERLGWVAYTAGHKHNVTVWNTKLRVAVWSMTR